MKDRPRAQEPAAPPAPPPGPPDDPGSDSLWVRLAQVFALSALFLSALLYPLRLREAWFAPVLNFFESFPGGKALYGIVAPYFFFQIPPLTVKETFTSLALLIAAALWWTWKLSSRPAGPAARPLRTFRPELALLMAFTIWALASIFRAPHYLRDSSCLYTAYNLAVWSLFALALLQLPRTARFNKTAVRCLVGVALVLMLISVAQATRPFSEYIFTVLYKWAGPYNRNLYGSLVGHNTGVAVICLGPFFFLLGSLFTNRKKSLKALSVFFILLSLYFFSVTKTRFVWVALPPLVFLFVFGLKPLIGLPIPIRKVLVGVSLALGFFVVLGLFVFLGPKHSQAEKADYIARIKSLRPSILLQGTRMRTFLVSGSLIAEKPFLGHGLGSYYSIYPKAQADYFAAHPDTALWPTNALTQRAHNDYLQLWVETGLVGLSLALATFGFFLYRGFKRLKRLESPEERLRRYCALFGIVSILLHALIDFPFHLAPLATFFLFYCYLFYGSPAEDEKSAPRPRTKKEKTRAAPAPKPWTMRPEKIVPLTLILALWCLVPWSAFLMGKRLAVDYHHKVGSDILESVNPAKSPYLPAKDRIAWMRDARERLAYSLHLDPNQFDARMLKGQNDYVLAYQYFLQFDAARKQGRDQSAKTMALNAVKSSIQEFQQASRMTKTSRAPSQTDRLPDGVGPRVNHYLLYYLALGWELLNKIEGRANPMTSAQILPHLEAAVHYAPGNADMIVKTIRMLNITSPEGRKKRGHYLQLLLRYNRDYLLHTYTDETLGDAEKAVQDRVADMALDILQELEENLPKGDKRAEVKQAMAMIHLRTGNPDRFREITGSIRSETPDFAGLGLLDFIRLVRSQEFVKAEQHLTALQGIGRATGENWRFARAELLAAMGKTEESKALATEIFRQSINPSQSHTVRSAVRRVIFGNAQAALDDDLQAALYFPRVLSTEGCLALLERLREEGDEKAIKRTLYLARDNIAKSPALRELEKQLIDQFKLAPRPR